MTPAIAATLALGTAPQLRRCGRINLHDPHDWTARPLDTFRPCRTYTCAGHVVTEGGWSRCPGCGTSGRPHPVDGEECREAAVEKAISQADR